ncbi:GGDEF domain-containing protein [bacterium]|nr:GGDEF domain-containing protein [bacterium]
MGKHDRGLRRAVLIVLCLALFAIMPGYGHGISSRFSYLRFDRLTSNDGLSQNSVNAILQDQRGFMWFGTQDGINVYDGYSFTTHKPVAGDSTTLSGNWVYTLLEDGRGWIWAGTYQGGVSCYRPEEDRFYRYVHEEGNPSTISHNEVRALLEDNEGRIWIGTFGGGLDRLDPLTGSIEHLRHDPEDPGSVASDFITSLLQDSNGWIWVGTFGGGLDRWDPALGAFHHTSTQGKQTLGLNSDHILSLTEGKEGELWIGTQEGLNCLDASLRVKHTYCYHSGRSDGISEGAVAALLFDHEGTLWVGLEGNGLDRYNPEQGTFDHFRHNPVDPSSIAYDLIWSLYEDRSGGVWIGTNGGGVSRFDRARNRFNLLRSIPSNPNSLSQSDVRAVYIDDDGILWVGTEMGGLNRVDRARGIVTHYRHKPDNPRSISSDRIRAIHRDGKGRLWVGTRGGGLCLMNERAGTFTRYEEDRLSDDWVRVIFEDEDGRLYIGTGGSGLDIINTEKGTLTHIRRNTGDPTTMNRNIITVIYHDSQNNIWIGTRGGGLSRHNTDGGEGEVETYVHAEDDPASLSHNVVLSVQEDLEGRIWVGTPGGLNRYNPEDQSFTSFYMQDGLPNDVIYGILPDDAGNLWLSTNNGLCRFNPENLTFRNYNANDGLQSNEFNQSAYYRAKDGELFFGGLYGLNSFYPHHIEENTYIPPVEITAINTFDRKIPYNSARQGDQTITLPYSKNLLAFEFAALNYTNPEKNEYAYMLDGFNDDWVFSGNRRFVSYTNLNPGRYTFRVRGSNNDGVWNQTGAEVALVITPPWYRTWWFGVLVALFVLGLFLGFNLLQVLTMRRANRQLERKVQERTRELETALKQLHASREMQLESERLRTAQQMAASVAHEFNNPLAIISGVYDLYERQMRDSAPKEIADQLNRIPKTIQRMKSLVRRLLNITEVREADYAAGMKILELSSEEQQLDAGLDQQETSEGTDEKT